MNGPFHKKGIWHQASKDKKFEAKRSKNRREANQEMKRALQTEEKAKDNGKIR